MKITITPETPAEKKAFKTVEHTDVKEYLLFGNEQDEEGAIIDFHDWKGSYRYLIGSLYYFMQTMKTELSEKNTQEPPNLQTVQITPEMLGLPTEEKLSEIEKKLQNTKIPGVSSATTPHLKLAHSSKETINE